MINQQSLPIPLGLDSRSQPSLFFKTTTVAHTFDSHGDRTIFSYTPLPISLRGAHLIWHPGL